MQSYDTFAELCVPLFDDSYRQHARLQHQQVMSAVTHHTVDFEGFVASDIRGLCDQICTTFGPEVNCVG